MAQPNSNTKINRGYFHGLSKVQTEAAQYTFESNYKSSHSVRAHDVWLDSVPYAINATQADEQAILYPSILQKYTQISLTEIAGSNGQAWYLDDAGVFVRPWISPVDVPSQERNLPSFGYQMTLYRQNGMQIPPTIGVWDVDYYAGMVLFQADTTPQILGWGIPKVTCYTYIGRKASALTSEEPTEDPTLVSGIAAENIGLYKVVYIDNSAVWIADHRDENILHKPVGVAITSSLSGGVIKVKMIGKLINNNLNMNLNQSVYVGEFGVMTQVVPLSGYILSIGEPINATTLSLNVQRPLIL